VSGSLADLFASAMKAARAEQQTEREKAYELGEAAGDAWAAKEATREQLERLEAFRDEIDGHGFYIGAYMLDVDLPGRYDHATEILRHLGLATEDDALADGKAVQFFGPRADEPAYLAGWCNGALELWDAIKDEVRAGDGAANP
jgi:hypothetical protein